MSDYRFNDPPPRPAFGPKPEGDYFFMVASIDEPYRSKSGNLVLPVKLSILPDGETVFANPWAGTDKNGEKRDQIAEFLICINRAPSKGQEPDWNALAGAKGKCRLTIEIAQQGTLAGKEVNKVHYFYTPKASQAPSAKSFPRDEFEKAHKKQLTKAGNTVAAEPEPDDIPY